MRVLRAVAVIGLLASSCGEAADRGADSTTTERVTTSSLPTTTTTTTTVALPPIDWAHDLAWLDQRVRAIHPNPFWRTTEADWQTQLAAAKDVLPTLSRRQAEMVMFRLTALIDGHSGIYPAEIGYHLYSVRLYHFTDGYFVLDGPDPSAIGGQLVAINGMPLEDAVRLVTPLAAHDNDKSIEVVVPMLLMTPEMLNGLGIVDDIANPHFTVRRADGSEVVLDPEMLDWDPYITRFSRFPVGLPKAPQPLSQSRRDEAFWWTMVGDALYFQYNDVRASSPRCSLSKVAGEVRARLVAGGVTRVIVDVRHNPGGDNHTYAPLLNLLLDPLANRPAYLYVIIGRQTFSAAANFVTELDVQSSAVFVGEPTGGRPNLYGDVRPVILPSSHIKVNVSSRYWQKSTPDDERPWIAPDIPVELSSSSYFAGVDPVLDAALSG